MIDPDLLREFPDLHPDDPDDEFVRYLRAHDKLLDEFDGDFEDVVDSGQIGNGTGQELDLLGDLFGPLGKRRGRSDQEYRNHLRSVVQSFAGRGTIPGIKFAISSALLIDEENIEISEHYSDLEYTIDLYEWSEHSSSGARDLANQADPSVVQLRSLIYNSEVGEVVVKSGDTTATDETVEDGLGTTTLGNARLG